MKRAAARCSGAGSHTRRPRTVCFFVAPGETHANRADDECGCSFRTLYLSPDWVDEVLSQATETSTQKFNASARVLSERQIVAQYQQLHRHLEAESTRLERETRLHEFLWLLSSRLANKSTTIHPPNHSTKVIEQLRDFIVDRYADNLALEQLAQLAQLSPFHVNRAFSAQYGLPPHAFQMQVRIARARKLLRDGLPISQVAALTGFADQSHFTRHFKRLALLTPGQYQRDSKNVQDRQRSEN